MNTPIEHLRPSKQLRFGVEDAATGKVSGAFKIVRGRNDEDLYVMKRDMGDHYKASWHSGSWTMAADRHVRGFANQQWSPSVPPTVRATELVRILVPRAVAVRPSHTEPDSTVHVVLDDAHKAALFHIWLIPSVVRGFMTKPGTGLIGLLQLRSSRHNAVVIADWLNEAPPTPPIKLVDPEDSPRLLDRSQLPASSLTFWSVHDGQLLTIADLPSVTFNITAPS